MGAFSEMTIVQDADAVGLEQPQDAATEPAAAETDGASDSRPSADFGSLVDDLLSSLEDSPDEEEEQPTEADPFGAAGEESPEDAETVDDASDATDTETASADDSPAEETDTAAEEAKARLKAADDEKRREHEEKETRRRQEWEESQAKKKAEEDAAWRKVLEMTDDEAASQSAVHVGTSTERLTRRNMKICVTEHIQEKCLEEPAFARQTMHPRKNMINCFRYISRKAMEYLKEEIELEKQVTPGMQNTAANGGCGGDVPDDLCYQWAVEYFSDMEAPEDGKEEEFKPKPYYGGTASRATAKKKTAEKKKAPPKPKKNVDTAQLSLLGV